MTQINQYSTRSTNESSSSPKGSSDNPYTLEEFNAFEEGTWPGGYVDTMGYVLPEVVIEGGSGSEPDSSCSSEPDSEPDESPNNGIANGGGGGATGGGVPSGGASDGSSNNSGSNNGNSTGGDSTPILGDNVDEIVDVIEVPVELADAIASAAAEHAGNTQIGSNGRLYFQKSSGKVFRGNQYVLTISLSGLGKSIHKVLGPTGYLISVYNVAESYNQEGLDGAIDTAISEFYGAIGSACGATLGALIGTAICPGPGTAIGSIVGSILVGNGASSLSDYFIEISFDKPVEE